MHGSQVRIVRARMWLRNGAVIKSALERTQKCRAESPEKASSAAEFDLSREVSGTVSPRGLERVGMGQRRDMPTLGHVLVIRY
jgi:hypothetical protein